MANSYDTGRLNLPFVGIATFGKNPSEPDWSKIDADFAILGAPFDFGTQFRSGARFGPRAVREASTLFSFGHAGAYDHEDDAIYLGSDVRIVDMGDADIVHTDTEKSHANIEVGVRAGQAPDLLGIERRGIAGGVARQLGEHLLPGVELEGVAQRLVVDVAITHLRHRPPTQRERARERGDEVRHGRGRDEAEEVLAHGRVPRPRPESRRRRGNGARGCRPRRPPRRHSRAPSPPGR